MDFPSERKSLTNWKESSTGSPRWLGAALHDVEGEVEVSDFFSVFSKKGKGRFISFSTA